MAINNVHVLSYEDVAYLKEHFVVKYSKEHNAIETNVRDYNRISRYSIDSKIQLRWYDRVLHRTRKLTILPTSIRLWLYNFKGYHIVEVQNAVNMLLTTYQDVSLENVRQKLENPEAIKIRRV